MKLNNYIDHTLLKATATKNDILQLCDEAIKFDFKSVCVNPQYIELCKERLAGTHIQVCGVVGFPLGQTLLSVKCYEIQMMIQKGVDEIDAVLNVASIIEQDEESLKEEIYLLKKASQNRVLKLIIETCYLTDEQIAFVTKLICEQGIDFVKTSTGFGTRGASLHDIEIIKNNLSGNTKIKASGGIKTLDFAQQLIDLGVERLGTSSGVSLMLQQNEKKFNKKN